MLKHCTILVKGKVQGVFYRNSTKEAADQLGIKGWVRNTEDGEVLIEAQGENNSINAFLDWCRKGPPLAKVSELIVSEITSNGDHFKEFRIIR